MKELTKIVITGGPCAGKSTAMSRIQSEFSARGYTVLFVPETATELITGGVAPWTCRTNGEYQKLQMRLQLEKERIFERAAAGMAGERILIVCDRGLLDNRAYMNEEEMADVLFELGLSEGELIMEYDAVFHLVSAAKGADEFYTTANNAARRESREEAAMLDDRIISAWEKHPCRYVIDNSHDFEEKMRLLTDRIAEFLDGPQHARAYKKLLIDHPDTDLLDSMPDVRRFEIIQTYLNCPEGEERRVRVRRDGEQYSYLLTTQRVVNGRSKIKLEERITKREYARLLQDADKTKNTLYKTRYCFTYRDQYMEIDIYPSHSDLAVLVVDLIAGTELALPEWITPVRDITYDEEYKNINLAKRDGE